MFEESEDASTVAYVTAFDRTPSACRTRHTGSSAPARRCRDDPPPRAARAPASASASLVPSRRKRARPADPARRRRIGHPFFDRVRGFGENVLCKAFSSESTAHLRYNAVALCCSAPSRLRAERASRDRTSASTSVRPRRASRLYSGATIPIGHRARQRVAATRRGRLCRR